MILLLVILVAFVFAALTGFTLVSFLFGFLLGVAIVSLMPQLPQPDSKLLRRITSGPRVFYLFRNTVLFTLDFLWDLTVSNLWIAYDVWSPRDRYYPRLILVPVDDLSPGLVVLLANRITLTPGTLTVDVTEDRHFLIVHTMYPDRAGNPQKLRAPIDILLKGIT